MRNPLGRLGLTLAVALAGLAADWPQWRGPDRDDVSKETGLLASWPKVGPKLVWTFKNAGVGYSGPAVVGGRLYTLGARGDTEYLLAVDVASGQELWAAKIGPTFTFKGNQWGDGPRSTPSVDGGLVFALGGQGILICADAATGQERWRKDLPKDMAAEVNPIGGEPNKIGWGFTWSPLVDGEHLICVPGGPQGTVAALDKKSGKVVWRSQALTEQATYSSPMTAEVGGVRQYVVLTQNGPAAVAAKDGQLLWFARREQEYPDIVAPTPIVKGSLVYVSVGYGGDCELLRLSADGGKVKAEKVYQKKEIANCLGGVVPVGEYVYGYHEKSRGWMCQKLDTGDILWTSGRRGLGPGSVTYADGHLYCLAEDSGTAALVVASPKGYEEKGRFKLPQESQLRKPSGKVWTHPVVADGKLFLRDQELLFCFDIKAP
jgi:outer membrane protein assembly factor BamB